MAGVYRLLKSKWTPPFEDHTSFSGKTVLITGATGGLGLEAAQKIAALGPAKLIITARNGQKGQVAKSQIESHIQHVQRAEGSGGVEIDVYELDMGEFASVKAFADRVDANVARLDAVILNAGQTNSAWGKSIEGWEQTLQVNTISTVLLALLLLPKLLVTADAKQPAHLNFISSGTATRVNPGLARKYYDRPKALQAMSDEKAWPGGPTQYGLSKLLLEYSMRHIATLPSLRPPSGQVKVVVNSACPGMCKTDLGRQYTNKSILFRTLVWIFFAIFARTAENGSRTYVSALTRDSGSQGKLWKEDRYFDGGPMLETEEGKKFGEKIWKETVNVLESFEPRVGVLIKDK